MPLLPRAPMPSPMPPARPQGRTVLALVAGLGFTGVALWLLLRPKTARAEEAPAPPPPLPSSGDPTTVEYWSQPPPPGRETVGPTAPVATGTTYTIKAGEGLANVAERAYGNYRWWPYLWDVNLSRGFKSPDAVPAGATIAVPPKETLPVEKQAAYFARAAEHARIWSAWRKSANWGKAYPPIPPSVTTPTA